jgi:hypothetical protein
MGQVTIEITRSKGQAQASFQPDPAQATTQDNAFFVNNDTEPHLPTPLDKNGNMVKGVWLNYEIPGDSSSSGLAFFDPDKTILGSQKEPVKAPYTITYGCAVAGHENERGRITVTA